jgi:hypothetical protein
MSFVGTVQMISRIHDVDTFSHVTANDADSVQPIIVHGELLDTASGFFQNALDSEKGKRGRNSGSS